MKNFCLAFLFVFNFYFWSASQTNYWLTGEIHTEAIKKDFTCNCNDIRKIYYFNNNLETSSIICLDKVSNVVDGQITVNGYFDACNQFIVTKKAASTDLIKGKYKSTNYKCPLSNEGVITKDNGSKVDVYSEFEFTENEFVEVTSAAWSLKTCEGKIFSVYHIIASKNTVANETKKIEKLTGDFESYKGVRKPISQYGYNIGLLVRKELKDSENIYVCFDRLSNGNDLSISGFISAEGYFEMISLNPDPNSSHQVSVNPITGKSEPSKESQKIFFVTKIL